MAEDEASVRVRLAQIDAAGLVDREPLLRHSSLLRVLGEAMDQLLLHATVRRYPAGATIYGGGDAAPSVYLLARGEVVILSGGGADASPLSSLSVGDCFGAGAALGVEARCVTARAVVDSDLIELSAEDLREHAAIHPEVQAILSELHQKFACAAEDLKEFLNRW